MKLEIKTPQGEMQLTVSDGFVGSVEVTPEGNTLFSLFPEDMSEMGEQEQSAFLGD